MSWKIKLQWCLLLAVFAVLQSCSNLRPQFRYVNKIAANSNDFGLQTIEHKKAIDLIEPRVLSFAAEITATEYNHKIVFSTKIDSVQPSLEVVPKPGKAFKPLLKVNNALNALDATPSSTGNCSLYWLLLLPILFPAAAILGRQKKRSDDGCGGCVLVILLIMLLSLLIALLLF